MSLLIALLGLALLTLPLWWAIQRAPDLFVVEVDGGRCRLRRGRLPPRLLDEIGDIVRRNRVEQGKLRVTLEGGQPRVLTDAGFSPAAQQQLRNVVGLYRPAQLRTGSRRA